MNSAEIFLANDRLRPIWRFALSLILIFAAFVLTGQIVGTAFEMAKVRYPGIWELGFWNTIVSLVVILAGFKVMTAVFEGRPLRSIGLAFHPRWANELGRGLAVGAAMLLLAVGIEASFGDARFTYNPHPMAGKEAYLIAFFAFAAVNEEIIFRGYPFQKLVESITPIGAVALVAAAFGLAHLANPHRTWISTLNTALVGIPFCIAYLRTRALWLPIGIHFIWNTLMGAFLGLPVSGLTTFSSVLAAHVHGPTWLTGGEYGPEGGLVATGAILAGTAYISLSKRIYTTEEMSALVFSPAKPGRPDPPITIFPDHPQDQAKED